MEIWLTVVVGTLNIACFFVGAKVGQMVNRGEELSLPELNPVKVIQEKKLTEQQRKEQSREEIILQNIDAYDGTGLGQKDVPGR